jgi:hypothetical protein
MRSAFVGSGFDHLSVRIAAIRDMIFADLNMLSDRADAQTTAVDSYENHKGCRDYAHADFTGPRCGHFTCFVSAYAPNVKPAGFSRRRRVYLDGAWHLWIRPAWRARTKLCGSALA